MQLSCNWDVNLMKLDASWINIDATLMQLRCKFENVISNLEELRCNLNELRYDIDGNLMKLDAI